MYYFKTPKSSRKNFLILSFLLFLSPFLQSQTSTTSDGNWNIGGNWSSGVPTSKTKATVTNDMTMNVNIEIDKDGADSGNVIVNGGSINGSGTAFSMTVKGNGYLEVGGNVTVGGNFLLINDADFLIRSCDTLRIEGDVVIQNNSFFEIEECAVFYIEGNALIQNNNTSNVDGNIYVEGDLTVENNAFIDGNGNLEVEGEVDIKNAGSIFGNTTPCTPGPCEYGSGVGLPITLEKLEAKYINQNDILINWTTLSEINNDYFTIYYSTDGELFSHYEDIMGAGNSYEKKDYQLILSYSYPINYIKLIQTDFDGTPKEYGPYKIKSLKLNPLNESIVIAPNPGNGRSLTTILTNVKEGYYTIDLLDAKGRIIVHKQLQILNEESNKKIELLNGIELNEGIYFLRVNSPAEQYSKTYIVN